jgi:NDP-sugar pyrophosphorylase family protein
MQAIILAGGKGERLRPFTTDRPKAMVEIGGVPLLAYQMQWLKAHGVIEVVVACGYRHEVIQAYFGTGDKIGMRIQYSIEEHPLGRGGALKLAFGRLPPGDDACVATNGDVITTLELGAMLQTHRDTGCLATVMLAPLVSPYGIVDVDSRERIVAFREKPQLPYWLNAGIYILSRMVEPLLPVQGDHEDSTFPKLAAEHKLGAFKSHAYWRAIDTAKDITEAHKALEQRLIPAVKT